MHASVRSVLSRLRSLDEGSLGIWDNEQQFEEDHVPILCRASVDFPSKA